ncbi:hypothetical protein OTU49_002206, partial [Cherax quadricarinatus]
MAASVLHALIEVSEHFQELMRLAAADGVIESWGLEIILQNVNLSFHEDDNFQGHLLFGLHSLLLLLVRKLEDLGHDLYTDACGCGWDTSQLPESQHTDIHRYTSGTVVRWVQGECYVLLASTEAETQVYQDGEHEDQPKDECEGKPGSITESNNKENSPQEHASEDTYLKDSYQGQEESEDNHLRDSGEEPDPPHTYATDCDALDEDDDHGEDVDLCQENEETDPCHSSTPASSETGDFIKVVDNELISTHTRLNSDSNKLPSVWSGCQIHSCSAKGEKYNLNKWKKLHKRFSKKSVNTIASIDYEEELKPKLSSIQSCDQEYVGDDCEMEDQAESYDIKQEMENVEDLGKGVCNGFVKKYSLKRKVDADENYINGKSRGITNEDKLYTVRNYSNPVDIDIICADKESESEDSRDGSDNRTTNEYLSSEEAQGSEYDRSDGEARIEAERSDEDIDNEDHGCNDEDTRENSKNEEEKSPSDIQPLSPVKPSEPSSSFVNGSVSAVGAVMSEDSIDGDNSCTLIIHEEDTREGISREETNDGMSSPNVMQDAEPCKLETDKEARITPEIFGADKVNRAPKEEEQKSLEALELPLGCCSLVKDKKCNSE